MNTQEPRKPLINLTNDISTTSLPSAKRKRPENEDGPKEASPEEDSGLDIREKNLDVDVLPNEPHPNAPRVRPRRRHPGAHGAVFALKSGISRPHHFHDFSTASTLESFVSSNKSDLISCRSLDSQSYLIPPYACAFSNTSKLGKATVLAVATEEGTVDILNTIKRNDWDPEPTRTTLQIHNNGIFDVKWSPSDALIATASGDKSICITDPKSSSGAKLYHLSSGHTSTIKTIAWDPSNDNILASGGRDGCICLWDLRTKEAGHSHCDRTNGSWTPALIIPYAHENSPGKPTKHGRTTLVQRSVTSIIFVPQNPYHIISSGSGDGILRKWDLRYQAATSKRSKKMPLRLPIDESSHDFTTFSSKSPSVDHLYSPRRARGIISLAIGSGPSAGRVFALGNDSRIHTYNTSGSGSIPLGVPQTDIAYAHRQMYTNSFYVRTAVSPCGRWLAAGGSSGSAFLFDASAPKEDPSTYRGIELPGQKGEVGAVDWADETLASCADDGTVRIWRLDTSRYHQCIENEEESRWDWIWGKV